MYPTLRRSVAVFLIVLTLAMHAWAIDPPLRDPSGLAKPTQETMVRVTSARVILADYDLLKKDFSELRNMTNQEIDHWLLNNTAFVSKPQAEQEVVNTHISINEENRVAFRPESYGRAVVFKTDNGLIDAKGVGAIAPRHGEYGDGLATLGETIREYAFEKMIKKVLVHSNSGMDTVGSYAVIDQGFDVIHPDKTKSPAGMILRQAHQRSTGKYQIRMDQEVAENVEKTLRRYGVTSAGVVPHGYSLKFDYINIQGTEDNRALIDFGAYIVKDKFDKPTMDWDSYWDGSRKVVLDPKQPSFVQPDVNIEVPLAQWGHSVSGKADPKFDNPWVWSHELAESIRNGTATRADAEQHIRNLLGPVERRLSEHPFTATSKTQEIVNSNADVEGATSVSTNRSDVLAINAEPAAAVAEFTAEVLTAVTTEDQILTPKSADPSGKVRAFAKCLINNLQSLLVR